MKNKKNIIIICCIVIYFSICLYFFIQYFDIFHTTPIVSLNELSAIQNEEVTNVSYIKNIKYGKLISKEKIIDTSTVGKKKIVFVIQNNYGKKMKYKLFVNVVESK